MLPFWGTREFASIKRRDINELLDNIAKSSGWNADHTLGVIRKIAAWYATRDDDFVSPFVAGLRRTRPEDRERAAFSMTMSCARSGLQPRPTAHSAVWSASCC